MVSYSNGDSLMGKRQHVHYPVNAQCRWEWEMLSSRQYTSIRRVARRTATSGWLGDNGKRRLQGPL